MSIDLNGPSQILSSTLPPAPAASQNVMWAADGRNISASALFATASNGGFLTAADWVRFNAAAAGSGVTSVFGRTGTVAAVSGDYSAFYDAAGAAAAAVAAIPAATSSVRGLLVSADWTTFNSKQAALGFTPATLTVNTFSGIQTFSAAPVFTDQPGSRTALGLGSAATQASSAFDAAGAAAAAVAAIPTATASVRGLLSAADWTTFNAKQTALTLPLSIANGGTGAATFVAAGLPTLGAAANAFTGSITALNGNITAGNLYATYASNPVVKCTTTAATGSATFQAMNDLSQGPWLASWGSTNIAVIFGISVSSWGTLTQPSGSGLLIGTQVNGPLVFGQNNLERMRLAVTSGNLLIGTTTDAGQKLQVNGTLLVAGAATFSGGLNTHIRTVTTSTDTATISDHTLILNATSLAETLPSAPSVGIELYLVNIASTSAAVSGNGINIWAAGTSAASIALAANTTAILQYDGTLWRQIK